MGHGFPLFFPLSVFGDLFGMAYITSFGTGLGRGQRGACNMSPSCGLRTANLGSVYLAIYLGRMRAMNKQKTKYKGAPKAGSSSITDSPGFTLSCQ